MMMGDALMSKPSPPASEKPVRPKVLGIGNLGAAGWITEAEAYMGSFYRIRKTLPICTCRPD